MEPWKKIFLNHNGIFVVSLDKEDKSQSDYSWVDS